MRRSKSVSTEIGQAIRSNPTRHEVVIRSTVLPGTTRDIILPRLIDASEKSPGDAFGVAFNPEFMREGSSVTDFNNPSRTIVGARAESMSGPVALSTSRRQDQHRHRNRRMVKYVDNTWHA